VANGVDNRAQLGRIVTFGKIRNAFQHDLKL
jgi:hypothetical protein